MSGDSSSDGEWCEFTKPQAGVQHSGSKCWECGKTIHDLNSLLLHYKSHNIEATCHICEITFRRLTSLSTHLENAHLPPFCPLCRRSFENVWDLNKHARTRCESSGSVQNSLCARRNSLSDQVTEQRSMISTHHNTDCSLSSVQEAGVKQRNPTSQNRMKEKVGNKELGLVKKSNLKEKTPPSSSKPDRSDLLIPTETTGTCSLCDRGPFRSLKQHWRYCTGVKQKYPCVICKKILPSKADLRVHHMPLHLCHSCGQVFPSQAAYSRHQCRNAGKSTLVLFCAESMPKVCNICKCFFISEKMLSIHVTKVHTSVVTTKICIATDPSLLTNKREEVDPPGAPKPAVNGGVGVNKTQEASLPNGMRSNLSSLLAASLSSVPPATVSTSSLVHRIANQIFTPSFSGTSVVPAQCTASEHGYSTSFPLLESENQQPASKKQAKSSQRPKPRLPCRQCGAVLRQPSSIITHRYLHRGRRSHRCQCGRAFKHRLHLLRHCIQHAEASNYICATCGKTFIGAKLLAQHVMGNPWKKSHSESEFKAPEKNKCSMPFLCDCGQQFLRPSAYIWHQLQNWTKNKQLK